MDGDHSRVRQRNAALVLGLFRRLLVCVAQTAMVQRQTPKTRWTVRRYHHRFARRDAGQPRLAALLAAKAQSSWQLPKQNGTKARPAGFCTFIHLVIALRSQTI